MEIPPTNPIRFAGTVDRPGLIEWSLLKREECDRLGLGSHGWYALKNCTAPEPQLLQSAFARAKQDSALWGAGTTVCCKQVGWMIYALYLALKQQMGGKPWQQWDAPLAKRDRQTLKLWKERLQEEMEYHCWVQYLFFEQWAKLKEYCNRKGVRLIGDIPIYVLPDSCDTWVNSRLFDYDEDCHPLRVAGCPARLLSKPVSCGEIRCTRWDVMEKEGFAGGLPASGR